ncbi:MAG: DUF1080 domain-containing protein [Thermoguttaceae bacterium]|jgi:hypothetical protein|nr:DUF1080 domain-containing protein [Thermoguttaceae bacterium]
MICNQAFAVVRQVLLLTLVASSAQDKLPIPPAEDQAKALDLIKEVYGQEWEEATTSKDRQALAVKLLQRAKESADDDANHYMLLHVAQNLAAQAGDAELAFKAIEAMAAKYDVDAYRLKGSALSGAAKSASTAQSVTAARLSLALIDEAVDRDDFVAARFLGGLATDAARKGRDLPLVAQIVERNREVEEVAQSFADIQDALAALKSNPVDPDANLAVGKYHCFLKGNWNRGLPMLALGSDGKLKELAVKDLKSVEGSDELVALGDGWWDLAAASEGMTQKQLQERAAVWYRKALPGLSGLVKDRVAMRLGSLRGSTPSKVGDDALPKDEWISIFDGRSLKGWEADQNGHVWSVIEGAIVGRGRPDEVSHLYSQQQFTNFELRADVQINAGGNSGVYFRAHPFRVDRSSIIADGYEVQIIGSNVGRAGGARSGSLIISGRKQKDLRKTIPVNRNVIADGRWFNLHLLVQDNRFVVTIDGHHINTFADPNWVYRSGRLALQHWWADTFVSYKNIAVRPLP